MITTRGPLTVPAVAQPAFELRRALNPEDWRRVGLLRYKALRAREDIPESPTECFGDWHDRAFNCQAYLLTRLGRPAGTTRSSVSSASRRWSLPSIDAFEEALGRMIGGDLTVLEASLTALDPTLADPRVALFHLFKAHMLRCAAENADWLVTAVPEPQIGFYRRMFNMRILSGAERCPGVAGARVLMGMDFGANAEVLRRRMPMLAATPEEESAFACDGAILFSS